MAFTQYRVVSYELSIRLHRRRQSDQDRVDHRRTRPAVTTYHHERSITAQRLTDELDNTFALCGRPPQVLRMGSGPEFMSHVLQQFCRVRVSYPASRRGRRGTTGTLHRHDERPRLGRRTPEQAHTAQLSTLVDSVNSRETATTNNTHLSEAG